MKVLQVVNIPAYGKKTKMPHVSCPGPEDRPDYRGPKAIGYWPLGACEGCPHKVRLTWEGLECDAARGE